MSTKTKILDGDGSGREAHVHPFSTAKRKDHSGLLVLTRSFQDFNPEFHPFLNAVNGTNMAVDAGFSGVAALIYASGGGTSAANGTTSADTTDKLEDDSQAGGNDFDTTLSIGMVAEDSASNFAHVTALDSSTVVSVDSDIFGNAETYTVGEEWAGTAVQGGWGFTTDISIASANNGDEAQFDNKGTSVMTNYVAVTGKITLTTWNEVSNQLLLSFGLAGVLVGNSVDLNNYIDTGLLGTEQTFVIPKADLGLTTQTVDDMNLIIFRTGGAKPTIDLDDIQLEKAGGSVVYKAKTPLGTRFHISEFRIALADNITGITTVAGATETATVPNLAYDDFMGITSPLTNGVVFSRIQKGKTLFSVSINQLGDFLATGSNIVNHISDGTNTFITILIEFPEPIVLEGGEEDFLSFTINDDLSGLLQFTAAARGAIEI